MIFILIVTFIGIILYETPDMIKNKHLHELKIFSIFLIIAFILSLFYILDIPIPNPVKGIEFVVNNLLHLNYN
ncbi:MULTISPECIES: hypothetical protein [Clostridium]|uniref:Uncharacterized protein n=3 Tax=Clostridium TaxID=1485 RepID=D8GU48_CLOLD|nr:MULTISPECIES: hypothetical protein [Clostridium]ADK14711.1 hypothetical protein CLJU_c16470 [Clostridium ljungdahlii DSM 13528]AGY77943.1 hypothetical protein CAETHG_3742 [Clostridium autoethanogenum DSM 10061]ALU38077.1 Hypothetical protein CLAU_3650 [Clostridium autoethanogenum DSM 10061]OAA85948.1 hypothetical protein WX45_00153 [Clostridium ljungdahlii DSM 13528]OVY50841.1 hypothetical protein WX72_02002 [Clostridium autoethanogenum]